MSAKSRRPQVNIFVSGKRYVVPNDLTIMDAMEYAGFRLIRGAGCRQGMCGACATLYRLRDDYRLRTALACQELVTDGMQVIMVPYSPATKSIYQLDTLAPSQNVLVEYYPELARCLCCNTCTKACPQDLEVMKYIQAALQGDIEEASHLSFECVECGLCALRCPVEIVPYYVTRLARRIYGRHMVGLSKRVAQRCTEIDDGVFDRELNTLTKTPPQQLRELYRERDFI